FRRVLFRSHARRRPAGPVDARRVPAPRPPRLSAAGGDRRTAVPQPALPGVLLSPGVRAGPAPDRGPFRPGGDRRAAPARARRRRPGRLVARPRLRGRSLERARLGRGHTTPHAELRPGALMPTWTGTANYRG